MGAVGAAGYYDLEAFLLAVGAGTVSSAGE